MLSELVKKQIETKSGISIRYSKDCDLLSEKIYEECKLKLSASTLRRLFGFGKTTNEVRVHTLDVISNYLGYPSWDDLIQPLDKSRKHRQQIITELKTNKLKIGERFIYNYKPHAEVEIEYLGKSYFKVISAKDSKLKINDIFQASVLTLHHPLFILEVERNGKPLGKIIEAKVSGVTSIVKL